MPDNGEWKGATQAQIGFLTDQLRDIRSELKDVSAVLGELRDFKTRVLAYAGLAAAGAPFAIQVVMERMGS